MIEHDRFEGKTTKCTFTHVYIEFSLEVVTETRVAEPAKSIRIL